MANKTMWCPPDNITNSYLNVCSMAAEDDNFFKVFKNNEMYKRILEHCPKKIADNHYRDIKKNNPSLLTDYSNVWLNDKYGGTQVENFDDIQCSSSTMQYLNVVSNLLIHYKNLTNFKIIEIGAGYGGQCKIINDIIKFSEYHIVDLKQPLDLQKKYLSLFEVKNLFFYEPEEHPKNTQFDIVISNYAFSEILEPLQTEYFDNIIFKSNHGYLTCNNKINNLERLKNKFENVTITPDIDGEAIGNYKVIW